MMPPTADVTDSLAGSIAPFLGTLAAALLAYTFARRTWRAQERRKVYAEFVHALSRFIECSLGWTEKLGDDPRKPHPAEAERIREALDPLRVASRDVALVGTETMASSARHIANKAEMITAWADADTSDVMTRLAFGETLPTLTWKNVDGVVTIARIEIGTDSVPGSILAWALDRFRTRRERRTVSPSPPRGR